MCLEWDDSKRPEWTRHSMGKIAQESKTEIGTETSNRTVFPNCFNSMSVPFVLVDGFFFFFYGTIGVNANIGSFVKGSRCLQEVV